MASCADRVRPLLLLDVDGPLNPFAAKAAGKPAGYVEHKFRLEQAAAVADVAGSGPRRRAGLGDPVGAQGRHDGPAIGLPVLPVIEFGQTGMEWKYPAVARSSGSTTTSPCTRAREEFLRARAGLVTELIRADPRTGLTQAERAAVRACLG